MKSKGNTQGNETTGTDSQTNDVTIIQPIESPTNERKYISKVRRRNSATNELMTIEETEQQLIQSYKETLQLIQTKGYGIAKACKRVNNMNIETFYKIVNHDTKYLEQYTQTQTIRAEIILDRMDKYVHSTDRDTYTNERGVELPNAVKVQRNRLMYDMDKWHLSKLNPKKYGDNITVKGDSENPLQIVAIKGMIIQ